MRAAGGEEGTATDGQTAPLIEQILGQIHEAAERKRGDQAAQLRVTPGEVHLWA